MPQATYSLLCYNAHYSAEEVYKKFLSRGIKVIWFGNAESCRILKDNYPLYCDKRLLQLFISKTDMSAEIVDGNIGGRSEILSKIDANHSPYDGKARFNSEQYRVEHSDSKHIVVTASAGTGKTSVMIDRIMFLIHTVKDLKMSDIAMITFTNASTNEMNKRLQQTLVDRYKLCQDDVKKYRYLSLLEEQSNMIISTIDSFSLALLNRYGIFMGYSVNIEIKQNAHELKEMNYDAIDKISLPDSRRFEKVSDQLGLELYHMDKALRQRFWPKLVGLGLTHDDIKKLNWGEADGNARKMQKMLKEAMDEMETYYESYKQKTDKITTSEALRELVTLVDNYEINLTDVGFKYLFIDEFQDSNNGQIHMATLLAKKADISLFVVGDPKQSIYRFRGANSNSFGTLDAEFDEFELEKPMKYTLVNNYRSSALLINILDKVFKTMKSDDFLDYNEKPVPCSGLEGEFACLPCSKYDDMDEQLPSVIKKCISKGGITAVLVRTNGYIDRVRNICNREKIPLVTKNERNFYQTDTVHDFYMMISSFAFGNEPLSLFNYLLTPYSGIKDEIDLNELKKQQGNREKILGILEKYVKKTKWDYYAKQFRYRPAVSVINEMMRSDSIVNNYISMLKVKNPDLSPEMMTLKVRQYSANLDKLVEIIQSELSEKASLFNIHTFLKYSIPTNGKEEQADIDTSDLGNIVYCNTVHGAKGLEYDNVILVYDTKVDEKPYSDTGILIKEDTKDIGWCYTYKEKVDKKYVDRHLSNRNYDKIFDSDCKNNKKEESRLLYVALTRAKKRLYCLTYKTKKPGYKWANYLLDTKGMK